jgi:ligand-binding SRPBCC domain-containing protein
LFTVSDTIHINAPIDRCFLLSTHVELAAQALRMPAVKGRTEGMARRGDRVSWGGRRFGLRRIHESEITRYERPVFFQDTMVRGRFKRLEYDHQFVEIDGQTLLTDKVRFSMPLGWVGRAVGKRVVVPRVARLLRRRLEILKQVAESDEWRRYLVEEQEPCGAGERWMA